MDAEETCREIVGRITSVRIGTSSLVVSRCNKSYSSLKKKRNLFLGVFAKLRKRHVCLFARKSSDATWRIFMKYDI
jgi:hypothetical protein